MGCVPSTPQQHKDNALLLFTKTSYLKTFAHPSVYPVIEIMSATYTDLSNGLNDWGMNNKDAQHLKTVLRAYVTANACIDKYVVILYKNQAWMYKTLYNDEIDHYRVITIQPPRA